MKKTEKVYLGLDIGTDSVGWAVTDEKYNLLRFHGQDAWGSHIFEAASLNADRRSFRSARRRLDRKKQRINLVRELFATEIAKADADFYKKLDGSYKFRDDIGYRYTIFNEDNYTDADYYNNYPTIHHLIYDLMTNTEPHDVRLVYLACAWLVSHRGHFFSNINKDNLSEIKDFNLVYKKFLSFFTDGGYDSPWGTIDETALGDALKKKSGITAKNKKLIEVLYGGKKPSKLSADEPIDEGFPFSREGIVKLLAGGTYALKDLFGKEEYASLETKSISLGMDDEKLASVMADIGDDYALIDALRSVYDWAVLVDALGEESTISGAKVKVYDTHKRDLEFLKKVVKKYIPKEYESIFRDTAKTGYPNYVYHTDENVDRGKFKKTDKEEFSKFILLKVKGITPDAEDQARFDDMIFRLEQRSFMPKQKDTDNRVIPHQLYWYELHQILNNAAAYLPFLKEKDEQGLTTCEKVESVFLFRIPYFVGPLNSNSKWAWIVRKEGKILPWNFEEMVDFDKSENAFIERMTNTCTYLAGEKVLPKDSLLYHKYTVLNEINNLRINQIRISVELKQKIYNEVFLQKKKISRKFLVNWLVQNGYVEKGMEDSVSGIDIEIKSNLAPQIAYKRLMESGILTESDIEEIIERASYAEDKGRLSRWIAKNYPNVTEEDRKYICSIKAKDFGRLSRTFLAGIEGIDNASGEVTTVIGALWNSQNNLMEIVADKEKYTFAEAIAEFNKDYYAEHPSTLEDRMNEMYLSNAVKRPVYRTLDIVKDVKKAFGTPDKIFVEMTRGGSEEMKGKRTKSRKEQIIELYELCRDEDVRILRKELDSMGDAADNKLQSEKLFLYYMQLGKCMYTGEAIDLSQLGNSKIYDVDHIYPQAFVKDDSIINNKVLVKSEANGAKGEEYPISKSIREKMHAYWTMLKNIGLISEEKYKRLTRATAFTDEERYNFINRQVTETSQSTKAVATLLKEYFPDTEIVYSKAKLSSEFRHEFDLYKSRAYNDLHHAVDAYLNIVVGNVYNMKFTKNFNVNQKYSIKTKTVFTHPVVSNGKTIWDGSTMLDHVKKTAQKNTAHFTKFAFFKKGGLFDQNPVTAGEGLTPLKKDKETAKYGGYNGASILFFIPVRYRAGKKSEIIIMSVEMLHGKRFLEDSEFAREYAFARLEKILNKSVDEISYPMGNRPWKVNTMLSLDGFRVCIAGSAGGGKTLIAQSIMQFSSDPFWNFYVGKLEKLVEKCSKNTKYIYDEVYDKVSREKNLELYDLYVDKYEHTIYSKRVNSPLETLHNGRDQFVGLSTVEQAKVLLNIHQTFGRISSGCDLTGIGGASRASATVNFSSNISNWAKSYKDVRIIDSTASGLWEKKSDNLLDLL